ncbi:hypothetical protein RFI_40093 [Reticulomyxa filosa]|uniref:CAP-Gly domain-containing protein n=1 Tax=Reticulomyxa filosa TaxID=46433 RepID=X6L8P3_RETFI|nr:hypothetical protein RFI_40093 [Reticulomyxa filosa]|eukprot:ETN97436.1 hypothetical protein RFI_40093 [Reticulomyxa filosa]
MNIKLKKQGEIATLDDTDQKSITSSVLMETSPRSAKRPKKTNFFWGTVAGLELQKNSKGKNSGHIDKIKYFECKPSKELFIKSMAITKAEKSKQKKQQLQIAVIATLITLKILEKNENRKMTTRKDNADLLKDLNRKQDKLIPWEWPGKFKQKTEQERLDRFGIDVGDCVQLNKRERPVIMLLERWEAHVGRHLWICFAFTYALLPHNSYIAVCANCFITAVHAIVLECSSNAALGNAVTAMLVSFLAGLSEMMGLLGNLRRAIKVAQISVLRKTTNVNSSMILKFKYSCSDCCCFVSFVI